MKIVYGVFGHGYGHSARSVELIKHFEKDHDVMVMASNDAHYFLENLGINCLEKLACFRWCYSNGKQRSILKTIWEYWGIFRDLLLKKNQWYQVRSTIQTFDPDIIISDGEPWVNHIGRDLGIPRINVDHFGMLCWCSPNLSFLDSFRSRFDVFFYRWLIQSPDRKLISSFFGAPVTNDSTIIVPPIIGLDVYHQSPSDGEHVLIYFNNFDQIWMPHMKEMLFKTNRTFIVYGSNTVGNEYNVEYKPFSRDAFLCDLASCDAVISNAGNQLVGEALHYKKPMLVIPEGCVEQRMNGEELDSLGAGFSVSLNHFTVDALHCFLDQVPQLKNRDCFISRNGFDMAIYMVENWMQELVENYQRTSSGVESLVSS